MNNAYLSDITNSLIKYIKLKIDDAKTEMLVITTPRHNKRIPHENPQIKVGNEQIKSFTGVRNLAVYFDSTVCMVPHVSNVVKYNFYDLQHISDNLRRHLDTDSSDKTIHSFVIYRLDFNSGPVNEFGVQGLEYEPTKRLPPHHSR